MKVLPIGEQDFEKIRSRDFLYVDKTEYIYNILRLGTYFFLSRPRRFGKTLLIDTMKTLFEGKREYFKGLWIDEHYDWEHTYPVIKINCNLPAFSELPLTQALNGYMDEEARRHGHTLKAQSPGTKLEELIKLLAGKDQKVAVLVDEYDKPLTDNLENLELARANREVLKKFYSPLKPLDDYLHMVFVTGVSKYGKVSIFSDLNNLNDLTLVKPMAGLTGYTQQELETNMAEHIADTAAELDMEVEEFKVRLREYYNGYSWDGKTKVYNPFSINKFFFDREFRGHWFSTGTPIMLVTMLSQQQHLPQNLEEVWGSENLMDKLSLEAPPNELVALLWQTGYLTIKAKKKSGRNERYLLGFPNYEVKDAFLLHVWQHYAQQAKAQAPDHRLTLLEEALQQGDLEAFFEHFSHLMATIPYQLFVKQEAYYHTLIYLVMELCGLKPASEVATSGGRADTVLVTGDTVYVFEFKIDATATAALKQIKEKGYHQPYLNQGKKIILVGVAFDTATRSLAGWEHETVAKA